MKLRFGQYKGKDIRNITRDYLEYLLRWDKLNPETRQQIEQVLGQYDGMKASPDTKGHRALEKAWSEKIREEENDE